MQEETVTTGKLAARMEDKRRKEVLDALGWSPTPRFSPVKLQLPPWNECLNLIRGAVRQAEKWREYKRQWNQRLTREQTHVRLLQRCYELLVVQEETPKELLAQLKKVVESNL